MNMNIFEIIRHPIWIFTLAVLPVVQAGCQPGPIQDCPVTLQEYRQMGREDRKGWPRSRVVMINVTRVGNSERTIEERLASLELVREVGVTNESRLDELAQLLNDRKCSARLKKEILKFLLDNNYSDVEVYLVELMSDMEQDPEIRDAVLRYVTSNPSSNMLARIVKAWDYEDVKPETEESYRNTVRSITSRPWDKALLAALADDKFTARPEAFSVLSSRLDPAKFKKELFEIESTTITVSVARLLARKFNYIPSIAAEIEAAEMIYNNKTGDFKTIEALAMQWAANYGYHFNIRDYHLISCLSEDPLRTVLSKNKLALELGESINSRLHVRSKNKKYEDSFWIQVEKLNMADRWNLYLIDEMLRQPRTQLNINLLASKDYLANRLHSNVRGGSSKGLVYYKNGEAELFYCPDTAEDRKIYKKGASNCLCRFFCRFESLDGSRDAGPSMEELEDAARNNYYGMIFTRTGERSFVAHYFNPRQTVISLGTYPLVEKNSEVHKALIRKASKDR